MPAVVPHRQLYRVVSDHEIGLGAQRSGVAGGYKFVYHGIAYVMTEQILLKIADDTASQQTPPKLTTVKLDNRPITADTKRLLVYFPGGIGDVISLKPVLQQFRKQRPDVELAVVSTLADQCLIGDVCTLWDYPVTEAVANYYDAWVNIAEMDKVSIGQELQETFADYLGVENPMSKPELATDDRVVSALASYLVDPEMPQIAVHLNSASHFRSIPHLLGAKVMFLLIERGCRCYVVGGVGDSITWVGPKQCPEGITDMTFFLEPLEHYMAFLRHMDVVLTCDTGAMHIAGALDVPTLALFGMTRGDQRTSFYPSIQYIQGEADCGPCENIDKDPPCTGNPVCMAIATIDPEYIADKIMEMVEYGRSHPNV